MDLLASARFGKAAEAWLLFLNFAFEAGQVGMARNKELAAKTSTHKTRQTYPPRTFLSVILLRILLRFSGFS